MNNIDEDKKIDTTEENDTTPNKSPASEELKAQEGDEEDPVNFHDSSDAEREAFFERSEEGLDEEEEVEAVAPERTKITSGSDFLTQELLPRAQRADPKLRSALTGKVLVHLTDNNTRVVFDGSTSEVSVQKVDSDTAEVDCVIRLPDKNLMRIYQGRLNPQLAMLSGKIKVEKQTSLAIYFFNLVAPRAWV